MQEVKPPSFFPTKKKLEAAVEVDGWINSCLRASLIYFLHGLLFQDGQLPTVYPVATLLYPLVRD